MIKILTIMYVLGWTALAVYTVGDMPRTPPTPYSQELPVFVFAVFFIPAMLGYFAGKHEE